MPAEEKPIVVSPGDVFSIVKGLYDLYVSQQPTTSPPSLEAILGGVRTVFQQVLALQAVEEAASALDSLQEQYQHYVNAPSGIDRLQNATQAASDLVKTLQAPSIRVLGHQLWNVAIGLQIVLLFERSKRDSDEIKNVVDVCKKAVMHQYGHALYVPEQYDGLIQGMYQHWALYFIEKYKSEHRGVPPPLPRYDEIVVNPTKRIVYPINKTIIEYGLEAIFREELCRKIDQASLDMYTNVIMWENSHVFGTSAPFRNRFLLVRDTIRGTPEWQRVCGRG